MDSGPDTLLLYGPETASIGMFEPKVYRPAEHAVVTTLTEGQDVLVSWQSYDGAGFDVQRWSARLRWDGSTMAVVTAGRVG